MHLRKLLKKSIRTNTLVPRTLQTHNSHNFTPKQTIIAYVHTHTLLKFEIPNSTQYCKAPSARYLIFSCFIFMQLCIAVGRV